MNSTDTSSFDRLSRSNANSAWGALAMEVLARLGVETVVVSPGSRSTPLCVAASRNPRLETLVFLDERSAAFFALGLAKRRQRPVVLVCTSGTAAANYFPAVVEASMRGVPLLVLTADRPPEDRACSSGQTIDQIQLYGEYPRAFVELALPEVEQPMLDYLRQTLVHAVERACNGNPGPVHVNVPFREPLSPQEEADPVVSANELEEAARVISRICEAVRTVPAMDAVVVERLASHRRGLIVVGDVNASVSEGAFAEAVGTIAKKLGWPVLADVLNPLRGHASKVPGLVAQYDTFLRDAEGTDVLRPDAVLQIGTLPTSKCLRKWLKDVGATTFLLSERPVNTDPLHRVALPLSGSAEGLAELLQSMDADADWLSVWQEQETSCAARLDAALDTEQGLFEGKAAWLLSRTVPEGSSVFLASSMSVRYAESFWSAGDRAVSIFSNRGANGIDGTLSTALGVAHKGAPAFLLTGDLAFLHDSNGLLAAKQLEGSLTVLVMNNNGGGIFEHLPVAEQAVDFEALFATPQLVDVGQLCAAHGVAHCMVENWETLAKELASEAVSGVRVLELCTDRKADRDAFLRLVAL
ncbi:MAG: 2-succinyl-5-enolpyruvyl-6-hydroxy-3-cyclohexene-1-carboxylic-acid synthase [Coraliomargaritaceae bacterium]